MPDKNISHIRRRYVIPAGTQVVLKQSLPCVAGSDVSFKKPGHVGVVVKCPPHNDLPYLIRFFNDQTEVEAMFDQLTLRRQEIDSLLAAPTGFARRIIYRCQVGSHAFGLSDQHSDDDIRGIFLPNAEDHWSLFAVPEQLENHDGGADEVFWELEKFLRLALKANPNILEILWTPLVIEATSLAHRLRSIRSAFLSKHVFKTYSGYVLSQFRRMKNAHEKTGKFKTKHAMHLLRLLISGIHVIRTGEVMIDVSEHRTVLLAVKRGEWEFERIQEHSWALDRQFQAAYEKTKLPDQPDVNTVNRFLIDARKSAVSPPEGVRSTHKQHP